MAYGFLDIAVTPSVRAVQASMGADHLWQDFKGHRAFDRFTENEAAFIADRDSFYMATVSETGWPYMQHRGGPRGFLKLLDDRTLAFADHTAQDVMTPRPRVASVERTDTAQDVIELARRTGFSRFPVIDDGIDDVVGIVHIKQAVAVPREKRADVPVSALQSDALRVPETMKLDSLLAELRGRGYQMAVVVDEYGGTAGVTTLEDLVEELVGEVSDEHDRTKADVVRSRDWFTFPGILRPDELLERTDVVVPEEGPYETVAGWLMSELGRLPKVGDTVEIERGVFRIERLEGRRIDRVRYTPRREPAEGDA